MNNFIFVTVFIVVMACSLCFIGKKKRHGGSGDAALKEVFGQAKSATVSAVF